MAAGHALDTRQGRIEALAGRLRHYDRSQLAFQLAEIAGDGCYLRHGVEVGESDTVLDVGANVGVAAAFFATQRGARPVHCFEPVAPVCELLRDNVGELPGCAVHEYGLASAPGRAKITFYPGSAAMSGLYADPARDREMVAIALRNFGVGDEAAERQLSGRFEARELDCELRTLSSFLRESGVERVDLLKIDVERAELEVLAGIEDADWPKIRQLAIEAHDEGGRCAAIAADLAAHGFRVAVDEDPVMRGTAVKLLYARRP